MSVNYFNKTTGNINNVAPPSGGGLKIFQQMEQPSEDGLWIKTDSPQPVYETDVELLSISQPPEKGFSGKVSRITRTGDWTTDVAGAEVPAAWVNVNGEDRIYTFSAAALNSTYCSNRCFRITLNDEGIASSAMLGTRIICYGAVAVAQGTMIYVFGGKYDGTHYGYTMFTFDATTETKSEEANNNYITCTYGGGCLYQNMIYLFGGKTSDGANNVNKHVTAYDISTRTFSRRSTTLLMELCRFAQAYDTDTHQVYIAFGTTLASNKNTQVQVFDCATETISLLDGITLPSTGNGDGPVGCYYNNTCIFTGGGTSSTGNTVQIDVTTKTMSILEVSFNLSNSTMVTCHEDLFIMIGGYKSAYTSYAWTMTPDTFISNTPRRSSYDAPQIVGRIGHKIYLQASVDNVYDSETEQLSTITYPTGSNTIVNEVMYNINTRNMLSRVDGLDTGTIVLTNLLHLGIGMYQTSLIMKPFDMLNRIYIGYSNSSYNINTYVIELNQYTVYGISGCGSNLLKQHGLFCYGKYIYGYETRYDCTTNTIYYLQKQLSTSCCAMHGFIFEFSIGKIVVYEESSIQYLQTFNIPEINYAGGTTIGDPTTNDVFYFGCSYTDTSEGYYQCSSNAILRFHIVFDDNGFISIIEGGTGVFTPLNTPGGKCVDKVLDRTGNILESYSVVNGTTTRIC